MSTQSLDPTDLPAAAEELEPSYRLAAAGREAAEDQRLSLLEQIYDPGSRRRRQFVRRGWRCLEIGAGVTVQSSGPGAGIPAWCSESCGHGSCRGGGDL
jgi:hypothetical protein